MGLMAAVTEMLTVPGLAVLAAIAGAPVNDTSDSKETMTMMAIAGETLRRVNLHPGLPD